MCIQIDWSKIPAHLNWIALSCNTLETDNDKADAYGYTHIPERVELSTYGYYRTTMGTISEHLFTVPMTPQQWKYSVTLFQRPEGVQP